jgi:uncharacterized protein
VNDIILSGIVGSTAYGLATPDSDVDRLGVFAAPTLDVAGLHWNTHRDSHVTTSPDRALHEARKYAQLALGANPTASELMWLPGDLIEQRIELGDDLIGIRQAFLSAKRVRDAYLGYATQQFRRLENRGDGSFSADTRKRTSKHARHLARLVAQGRDLYATGQLAVRLENPDWYRAFGEQVAAGDLDAARHLLVDAEDDFDRIRTPLPDRPDEDAVARWLRRVRLAHLGNPDDAAAA